MDKINDLLKKYSDRISEYKEIPSDIAQDFIDAGAKLKKEMAGRHVCAVAHGFTAGDFLIMPNGDTYTIMVETDDYEVECDRCYRLTVVGDYCEHCGAEL